MRFADSKNTQIVENEGWGLGYGKTLTHGRAAAVARRGRFRLVGR